MSGTVEAAKFATTVSGFVTPVIQGLIVAAVTWVGTEFRRLRKQWDRVNADLYPEKGPTLPERVEDIEATVTTLKARDDDRVRSGALPVRDSRLRPRGT